MSDEWKILSGERAHYFIWVGNECFADSRKLKAESRKLKAES